MKRLLFFGMLFCIISYSFAQDVQFPPSILAAGGGVNNGSSGPISKWRIGRVNVLFIGSEDQKDVSSSASAGNNELVESEWEILAYPNPVNEFLQIQFEIDKPTQFSIDVTDVSGRKLIIQKAQLITPNETVQLDLSGISPALYIVVVKSTDLTISKILKISKQ